MNSPSPCNKCRFLYYDCMYEDDPTYEAECHFEYEMGNPDCQKFKQWEGRETKLHKSIWQRLKASKIFRR